MRKSFLLFALFSVHVYAIPVNINRADAKTIADSLTRIGMKKAEAIVAYRTQHGLFQTVDELKRVSGIGEKTIAANRADILLTDTITTMPPFISINITSTSGERVPVTAEHPQQSVEQDTQSISLWWLATIPIILVSLLAAVIYKYYQRKKPFIKLPFK